MPRAASSPLKPRGAGSPVAAAGVVAAESFKAAIGALQNDLNEALERVAEIPRVD
jgi:hypothetical protein